MNKIRLNNLQLKTFIEQDAKDYCQINNLISDNIIELYLWNNELTDISGIKLFKNLEKLNLAYNKLIDVSVIQYLNNLKTLDLTGLKLESDQIKYVQLLKNLKELFCRNGFNDMSVLKQLNKRIYIYE